MPAKPMLAGKANLAKLRFPLYVQPKLDGIRATIQNGPLRGHQPEVYSRTLKLIPNLEIQAVLSRPEFLGLDGEILVGPPNAEDAYRRTCSFVMAPDKTGEPWVFYAFDTMTPSGTYRQRMDKVQATVDWAGDGRISNVRTTTANSVAQLEDFESFWVKAGYEGVIVRGINSLYKHGRGTMTDQDLLKVKRFEDAEAEIIGFEEELHNANEAFTNELGRTARSSEKAGKVGKGTLGSFIVRDLVTGVEFNVGTGFDAEQRQRFWNMQTDLLGQTIKYKFFPVGVKEKPRHPVFLGFRDMEVDG